MMADLPLWSSLPEFLDSEKCKNKLVKTILSAHRCKHAMNFKAEEKLKYNIVNGKAR